MTFSDVTLDTDFQVITTWLKLVFMQFVEEDIVGKSFKRNAKRYGARRFLLRIHYKAVVAKQAK